MTIPVSPAPARSSIPSSWFLDLPLSTPASSPHSLGLSACSTAALDVLALSSESLSLPLAHHSHSLSSSTPYMLGTFFSAFSLN